VRSRGVALLDQLDAVRQQHDFLQQFLHLTGLGAIIERRDDLDRVADLSR
jgi:hypothetical protein